jgi:hypothetical protein
LTIPSASREALLYLDAVADAQRHTPMRPSIVNGQIASAIRGEFGDVRFTDRTRNSELFINPLMAMYFTVDLSGLARRLLYLDQLADTDTQYEVRAVIEWFRRGVQRRERRSIPH